jgi:hypothetical protein
MLRSRSYQGRQTPIGSRSLYGPDVAPADETHKALLSACREESESDSSTTNEVSVVLAEIADSTHNLVKESVVRDAGLYALIKVAEKENARRSVKGDTYYSTKWIRLRWCVPGYMKHREDVFYVVSDLPYDMIVPNILHSNTGRGILEATRPDETEQQAFPVYGPKKSKSLSILSTLTSNLHLTTL